MCSARTNERLALAGVVIPESFGLVPSPFGPRDAAGGRFLSTRRPSVDACVRQARTSARPLRDHHARRAPQRHEVNAQSSLVFDPE